MTKASKIDLALKHQTPVALKVYGAVPISEPWDWLQIATELRRQGKNIALNIVQGCLSSLKKDGLIQETSRGKFVKKSPGNPPDVAPPKLTIVEKEPMAQPKTQQEKQKSSPSDILAAISAKARALADECEIAALEIDELLSSKDADLEKFKQLKSLLRNID